MATIYSNDGSNTTGLTLVTINGTVASSGGKIVSTNNASFGLDQCGFLLTTPIVGAAGMVFSGFWNFPAFGDNFLGIVDAGAFNYADCLGWYNNSLASRVRPWEKAGFMSGGTNSEFLPVDTDLPWSITINGDGSCSLMFNGVNNGNSNVGTSGNYIGKSLQIFQSIWNASQITRVASLLVDDGVPAPGGNGSILKKFLKMGMLK